MPERNGKWNGMNWIRQEKREAIYNRDERKCAYCGKSMDEELYGYKVRFTLDHLVPYELGGGNEATNLVTCCVNCNSSRGSKTLKKFLAGLEAKGVDAKGIRTTIRRNIRRKLVIKK